MQSVKKKRKRASVKTEKDKAWTFFSRYIRLRDCLETTGSIKIGLCCTCNHVVDYKKSQAGHFIPGRGGAILFLENNVHLQCYSCNVCMHGNMIEYLEFMKKKFGDRKVAELINKRHETHQWKVKELKEIKEKYKKMVDDILMSVEQKNTK